MGVITMKREVLRVAAPVEASGLLPSVWPVRVLSRRTEVMGIRLQARSGGLRYLEALDRSGSREDNDAGRECFLLIEGMLWHLRKALWTRTEGEINKSALLKTKKAIELTQEAEVLLQTTNVNPRLLLENLALSI